MIPDQLGFFPHQSFVASDVAEKLRTASLVVIGKGQLADVTGDLAERSGIGKLRRAATLPDLAPDTGCVLACVDHPDNQMLYAVNRASLQRGCVWLPGQVEYGSGLIGPMLLPRETSCYRCFTHRREANITMPSAPSNTDEAVPAALATCIGSIMVLEAIRLLSGFAPPHLVGRVLTVSLFSPYLATHRVLRLPNCPACGYGKHRLPGLSQEAI
jgi:bacteriocin biosynthesis cyclodehydratase domain-containing protein